MIIDGRLLLLGVQWLNGGLVNTVTMILGTSTYSGTHTLEKGSSRLCACACPRKIVIR